jgi:energy-coupling factor transporter ATP-binding protein EcfA2
MLAKLEAHRFLAVVGASGCGKSSLVRAGLLPALQESFLEGRVTDWRMLIMRPAGGPLAQLAQAFYDAIDERSSPPEEVAFTEATLRRSPRGLVDAIAASAPPAGTHYLLLVDQFEELFRFRYREAMDQSTEAGRAVYEARNEATTFVNLLLATAQQTAFPVYVVMTMR